MRVRLAHLRPARGLRAGRGGHREHREPPTAGRPDRRWQHDRPADQPEAAQSRLGLSRPGQVRWGRTRHRRAPARPEGLLRPPNRGHQRRSHHEPAVPGGDLRARGDDPAVRRRRRSGSTGQRQHLRTGCHRLDQGSRPRTPDSQAAQGRNRRAELSAAVRSLHALRRVQAVRLGLRVGQGGPRDLPANQDRLGPDVSNSGGSAWYESLFHERRDRAPNSSSIHRQ